MKILKIPWIFILGFVFILSGCSREGNDIQIKQGMASLSFATVLNGLVANKTAMKQALADLPSCSDGVPAFVGVVLTGPENVGTEEDPLVVSVNPTPGDYDGEGEAYFTEESSDLELPEGTYQLETFIVYDGASNVLWIAPRDGSDLASFVNAPLPMTINLGNGVKKYVDVEVLCFDDRVVNEYGYLFFDIQSNKAINLCVFGNTCDGNGRHFPAHFRLQVWTYSGDNNNPKGTPLFDADNPYINEVGYYEDGEAYARPLCIPLPDKPGLDKYYGEIYVMDFDDDDDEGSLVVSGIFTDEEVKGLYNEDGTTEYYHFRDNCGMGDSPVWGL